MSRGRRYLIDGEYDPVAAAAKRERAETQAAAARKAAEAKKASDARARDLENRRREAEWTTTETKKRAEEKARLARITARQEAAKLRSQERAARARAAKRVQETTIRVKTKTSTNKSALNQVMKDARKVTGTITDAGLKTKAGISSILDSWAAQNDKMYEKGSFLTPNEKAAALKAVQKDPFLAYDIMTDTVTKKPPKTVDEALNRMNYLVSEMALGGAREVALPFSLESGQPRRTEDALLQVVGGLLTPSPADMLISTAFRALASAGKKGTSILRKVIKGTSLASDEALQFEKLVGQAGYSTSDIRKAGTKLNKLTNAEWDEMLEGYQNYYDFWKKNPDLYGAGAAYKPSALLEFEDLLDDLGYDAGEYIDFLKVNKVGPTLNPATIAAFVNGLTPPTPDLDAYQKIESDIEKYRESLREKGRLKDVPTDLTDTTTELVTETELQEIERLAPDIPEVITVPIEITDITEDVVTIPEPVEEAEEEQVILAPPIQIPSVPEDVISVPDEAVEVTAVVSEAVEEKRLPIEEVLVVVRDKEIRRRDEKKIPRSFKWQTYNIIYKYSKGSETVRVKAHSFREAYVKGLRQRVTYGKILEAKITKI